MSLSRWGQGILIVALCAATLALLYRIWPVVVPFALGLTMAYVLSPLVDRLASYGLRRDRVVLVLYVSVLLGLVGLMVVLVPILLREISVALAEVPMYAKAANELIDRLNSAAAQLVMRLSGANVGTTLVSFRAEKFLAESLRHLPSNVVNALHAGLWAFIVPFVGFFALSQGRTWIDTLFHWTPSENVETLLGFIAELNARLGGYIRGVILESASVATATIVGLWFLGVEGAVLLGVITGLVNVVPFMAPLIGGTLAIAAGYFQGASVATLVAILVLYGVVRLLDDVILVPFVVGGQVQLHPVLILFAVLTGIELAGVLGLLFAIPITVILKVILSVFLKSQRDNIVLKHHDVLS